MSMSPALGASLLVWAGFVSALQGCASTDELKCQFHSCPEIVEKTNATDAPTRQPTEDGTHRPSPRPTSQPSDQVTVGQTHRPTSQPTKQPTDQPTLQPTLQATLRQTDQPIGRPTDSPTDRPTSQPTPQPTSRPTDSPTDKPTPQPTSRPTDSPTHKPTSQPTPQPTSRPTASPTNQPTHQPTEMSLEDLSAAVFDYMSTNNLISQINSAVKAQVPKTITFTDVKGEAESSSCEVNSPFGCICRVNYKVSGELNRCSGLNSVELLKLFEPDNVLTKNPSGDIVATLTPSFRIGGVSCKGEGKARGGACGINMNANAKDMSAQASVSRIDGELRATVEQRTDGKICVVVNSVKGRFRKSAVQWRGFSLRFSGLPIGIPSSVLNKIWNMLPLDKPINSAVTSVMETVETELHKMDLCF